MCRQNNCLSCANTFGAQVLSESRKQAANGDYACMDTGRATLTAAMKYKAFLAMDSWLSTAVTKSLTARLVAQQIGARVDRKKHNRHHSRYLSFCKCQCSLAGRQPLYRFGGPACRLTAQGIHEQGCCSTLLTCSGPNLRNRAATTSKQPVASTGSALCQKDKRRYHLAFGRFGSSSRSSNCAYKGSYVSHSLI